MSERDLLLGVDIGTQGVKAALVERGGRVVARAQVEHDCSYPRPGWAEHDMTANWWQNPLKVIRAALADVREGAARVAGVGVSGLYPALGPTDGEGTPLAPAILYSDNRALAELEEVNQALGLNLTSEELTPRLIWLIRRRPELAARMRMFFDAAHYLVYRLCGAYVTDTITVGLYGAIHSAPTMSWRGEVCARFGIDPAILPRAVPPATVVGEVHGAAAAASGLAPGTPVLAGMPDLVASILSAGAVARDEAVAYYGTAGVVPVSKDDLLRAMRHPFPEEDGYLYDYPHYSLAVGEAVRWFRETFGRAEVEAAAREPARTAYQRLDALAAAVPAGSEGLLMLPYFQGQRSPVFNPAASGVFFGMLPVHGRGHYFRAVLEAFGYSIRHGLESYYPHGIPLRRLVATGGGARSALWRQIVSDITGLRQDHVPEAEGAVGSAYAAALGIGWFEDFGPLERDWVRVAAEVVPDPAAQQAYERLYPLYVRLHEALREVWQSHRALVEGRAVLRVEPDPGG